MHSNNYKNRNLKFYINLCSIKEKKKFNPKKKKKSSKTSWIELLSSYEPGGLFLF